MLQRIVLVLVIILCLAVIGAGLRMFITQRYKTVSPEDFARNVESLKNQGAAMEQEAIAERLEGDLAAAREEAEQQRMRAGEYDRLMQAILSEKEDSRGSQQRPPGELLLMLNARLAQEAELEPEEEAKIRDRVANLQAELAEGAGPVCLRGAVRRPGVYMPPAVGAMTLGQLLKAAGVIDDGEGTEFSVRVFRAPHDPMRPVFFVVARSIEDVAANDFDLAPNDVIIVELSEEAHVQ